MGIGLEDTLTYYDDAAFIDGFKKTMAFQPRVVKQNRGSAGEGIWIIKLKEGNYCSSFGERSCEDSEVLSLMEANDNHAEEHTVQSSSSGASTGGRRSPALGTPRERASTSRAGRLPADSLWTSDSARVSWRGSYGTTWSGRSLSE